MRRTIRLGRMSDESWPDGMICCLRCSKGDDVGVRNFILAEMEIFLDRMWQQRLKLIPREECDHCIPISKRLHYNTHAIAWNRNLGRKKSAWTKSRTLTEAEPSEEEDSSILVEGIEDRNRSSFPIYRVDFWCLPEGSNLETHVDLVLTKCVCVAPIEQLNRSKC